MKPHRSTLSFACRTASRRAAALLLVLAASGPLAAAPSSEDEAAIRGLAQTLQEGWNRKSGAAFAAPFAEEHDYVAITGLYRPGATRGGNAAAHQQLFDGIHKNTDLELQVSKVRFLSADIAVAHLQGHTHASGDAAQKRQSFVITAVLRRQAQRWEIVAFQNTPVLQMPPPSASRD